MAAAIIGVTPKRTTNTLRRRSLRSRLSNRRRELRNWGKNCWARSFRGRKLPFHSTISPTTLSKWYHRFDFTANCCWLGLGNWWSSPVCSEETKSHLVECVAPILKRAELRKFCARLFSSSRRTLLRSIPGWFILSLSLSGSLDLYLFLCFSWKYSLVWLLFPIEVRSYTEIDWWGHLRERCRFRC